MVRLLPINEFSRPGQRLESVQFIVWHWTGNAGKGVDHTGRYFEILGKQDATDEKPDQYASAHLIIDKRDWLLVVPLNEVAYHAGSRWWNHNSIGIEICHPDWSGVFPEETLENLYETTAFFMRMKGLTSPERIKRHYDITGKLCPKWFVEDEDAFERAKAEVGRRL
jgi:N-acetylmuramoyl-L-alanine amidase